MKRAGPWGWDNAEVPGFQALYRRTVPEKLLVFQRLLP
jgi:hypothetical protein